MIAGDATVEVAKQASWMVMINTFAMGTVGIPPLAILAAMFGSLCGQAWSKPIPGRQQAFTLWLANVGVGCICPVLLPQLIGWSTYNHETMVGAFAFFCALASRWVIPFCIEVFTEAKDVIKAKVISYINNRFPKA